MAEEISRGVMCGKDKRELNKVRKVADRIGMIDA